MSVAQEFLRKSTDFLRRITAPVDGIGGVTSSYVCPQCGCFPLFEGCIWWVSTGHGKRQCSRWCAACGGQTRLERHPTGDWLHNSVLMQNEANSFLQARVAPLGPCDTLVQCLRNFWRTSRKMRRARFQSTVTGLRERSRTGTVEGLRSLMGVDDRSAVVVGGLRRGTTSVPDADHRWWMRTGMPFLRLFYTGIEGTGWEEVHYHHRASHQAAGTKKPGQKAKGQGPLDNESGKGQRR